jgi:hypothetical protein
MTDILISEWNFILTLCHHNMYAFAYCTPQQNQSWYLTLTLISRSHLGQKPVKTANSLKNLFLQNRKCQRWTKSSFKSLWGPFSSLFEATSCDRYFSNYSSENAKVLKITISMLNNFFTIGFRTVLPGNRKSYPRNLEMYPCLTFDLYFKVKPRSQCLFLSVVIIKLIFHSDLMSWPLVRGICLQLFRSEWNSFWPYVMASRTRPRTRPASTFLQTSSQKL